MTGHMINEQKYDGKFDANKVSISGWQYSHDGININFSPTKPTHAVVWMRPDFVVIDKIPEGFVLIDAYDAWPDGMNRVVNSEGKVVNRPPRGTWVLAPLPKEL